MATEKEKLIELFSILLNLDLWQTLDAILQKRLFASTDMLSLRYFTDDW